MDGAVRRCTVCICGPVVFLLAADVGLARGALANSTSKVLIMATYYGGNGGRIWGKSQKWRGCRISWRNGGATRGVMGTNFCRAPDGSGPDTGVKSREH